MHDRAAGFPLALGIGGSDAFRWGWGMRYRSFGKLRLPRRGQNWENHHSNVRGLSLNSQLSSRRGAPSQAAYRSGLKWAVCAID